MTVVEMRKQVSGAYSGTSWEQKVKRMSDGQVQAIFFRLKKQGKL